ncbi:MAG: MBL fold metallo-hydrolase [Blastochloris sp.]|nr:MBL fold metallo-hydrolase [Blastochloris sp.]
MPALINLTRANEIGANCYYLDLDGEGLLLDAGMQPKGVGFQATPHFDALGKRPVSSLFLTHAHHDHTGALPLAMQRYPDAKVFLSEPTYFLAEPLLHNSVNVMKRQRLDLGITEYPLFSHGDLKVLVERWQACHLNQWWSTEGSPLKDHEKAPVKFRFHHAGHILGAVMIELEAAGRRILYTGDINLKDQTILNKAKLPPGKFDTLIIECTRGANPTPKTYSRKNETRRFLDAIIATFERHGGVLIPVFAMGKTQEILTILHEAQRRGELPDQTINIGGLARIFTEIYDRMAHRSERLLPNLQIMEDIRPQVFDWTKLKDFHPRKGEILLVPAGMMTEQTTSNRLAQSYLAREQDSIFFVGYCDPDSPAGRLRRTPRGGRVTLNPDDGDQPVLCQVESFDFTSHALREDLLDFILEIQPKTCFLVHGDAPALAWFQSQLAEKAPKITVHIPAPDQEIPF